MKRLFIFGVCALVVLCMASCYPEGPDYVHEKDIALTHYDEEADFSTLKTFVIPDSVVYVRGDSNATGLANELKEEILSLVKQNFEAYNYQLLTDEEAEAQTPDFVVTVTAFATPTFSYNSWGKLLGLVSRLGLVRLGRSLGVVGILGIPGIAEDIIMLMTKVRWLSICWMRKRPIKKPNGYRYCGQGWSMVSWPEIRTILPNAWRKISTSVLFNPLI